MPTPKYSGPDETLRARLAGAVGIVGLLALNGLGLQGIIWWVVVCCAALSVNWASRRASGHVHTTDVQRFGSALSVAVEGLVWAWPSVLLWGHGDPGLRVGAVGLLFLQIFFAAAFAYREWVSLIICGVPPALVLVVLVCLDDRAGWIVKTSNLLVVIGTIGFALLLARFNARALESMVAAGPRAPGS